MNYELIACNNFCKVLPDLTGYITENMVSAGEEKNVRIIYCSLSRVNILKNRCFPISTFEYVYSKVLMIE